MATEKGIVIRETAATAWVKTNRTEACKHCASRGSCHTVGSGEEMEVEAINMVGAKAGDHIILTFETAPFLKATFLLYVFPIIMMLIGAAIGQWLAVTMGWSESPSSLFLSLIALFLTVLFVRKKANQLAGKKEYRPKITHILKSSR